MKTLNYFGFIAVIGILLMYTSCKKDDPQSKDLTINIVGTYTGTLNGTGLKNTVDASSVISRIDNALIHIHCYSTVLDTTFSMELFEYGDSLMVCNIGNDFTMHYGHERMNGHHMMDDSEAHSWMHHLDENHQAGDYHFGGFNIIAHSFNYRFVFSDNSEQVFNGIKKL